MLTTRHGGVSVAPYQGLDLATHVGDDLPAVQENRALLLAASGAEVSAAQIVCPNQVHGSRILEVDGGHDMEGPHPDADALLCASAGVPVLLCYADCVPLVMVAPGGTFCVVHAGWRGSLAGIAGKAVAALCVRARCAASVVNVYIGAHIRECCYETSETVLDSFVACYGAACAVGNRHLSLSAALRQDLSEAGVVPWRIAEVSACTSCDVDDYFSYRAEGGVCGRHGALAFRSVLLDEGRA